MGEPKREGEKERKLGRREKKRHQKVLQELIIQNFWLQKKVRGGGGRKEGQSKVRRDSRGKLEKTLRTTGEFGREKSEGGGKIQRKTIIRRMKGRFPGK